MPEINFFHRIKEFNDFYKLESNDNITYLGEQRIRDFKSIILEEVREMRADSNIWANSPSLDLIVDLADWLGDIIIYCASEARRWGIPIEEVLDIIMDSNMSKAQACGECSNCVGGWNHDGDPAPCLYPKPLYDPRGKVLKGPNYWKPEPKIKELLLKKLNAQAEAR